MKSTNEINHVESVPRGHQAHLRQDAREPLVYVLILNWNGWKDTLECLGALSKAAYTNFRIIVIDNGSTDDSVARIQSAGVALEILETGQNLGFAGGNNVGIERALRDGAEFVWLLNNDTVPSTRALLELVSIAMSKESIGAVGSVLNYYDAPERVQVWGGGYVNHWTGVTRSYDRPVLWSKLSYINGASLLVRSSAIRDVGLLDDAKFMYWEDTDFGRRLQNAGWGLGVASNALVLHKVSSSLGGESSASAYDHFVKSATSYFLRHAPVPIFPLTIRFIGGTMKWALARDWRRLSSLVGALVLALKRVLV